MMKTKLLLMLVAVGLVAGTAQANLLVNPSFEDGVFEPNDPPEGWSDNWPSYASAMTWLSNDDAHTGDKYIQMRPWTSGAFDAFIYQDVDVTAGEEYNFTIWAKNAGSDPSVTTDIVLYATWRNSSGTQISEDSAMVTVTDKDWGRYYFGSPTASALATTATIRFGVPVANERESTHLDDASMVGSGSSPSDPSPPHNATVKPDGSGNVELSWTNLEPSNPADSVYVDVWFGTNPNIGDVSQDYTKVVTEGENTTTVTVSVPTEGEIYHWQVDSYIYGDPAVVLYDVDGTNPNGLHIIEGLPWIFNVTYDFPPELNIDTPDMITWSGESVQLNATIVDDAVSALTYLWSADPASGVVFTPNAYVEDPCVTITDPLISIPIDNAGFEEPGYNNGYYGWNPPGWGWFATGYVGAWNPLSAFGGVAPEGQNLGFADGLTLGEGGFAQILTETLTADATYTLTVEVGNVGHCTWTGYKVQLLAGGTGTAPGEITGGFLLAEDDNSLSPIDVDTFETSTVVYTYDPADANKVGQPLQIRLIANGGNEEVDFDDVKLFFGGPAGNRAAPIKLTLAVNDVLNLEPAVDTMTIDVYADACKATRVGLGLAADNPGDFDEDCDTDLADIAVMAIKWLNDIGLTEPIPKP